MSTDKNNALEAVDFGGLTETQAARIRWLLKVPDSEPIFTLRAQDVVAADTIRDWANRAEDAGAPVEKVTQARADANAFATWSGRKKIPD